MILSSHPGSVRIAAALAVGLATAGNAQAPDSVRRRSCSPFRPALAVEEVMALNLAVNRFDAWVIREDWARADFESWARNFRLGWEWDENNFNINMIMHPFHGSQYFNSGRSNCLTYWESVPLAFFGSWVWEFFGETHRPSLNDFFMTSFGGIALGEMTTRVTATIRNTETRGTGRFLRETMSLLMDPMGGLNRLFRGEWKRIGPNPPEHDPGSFVSRLGVGAQASVTNIGDVLGPVGWAPTVHAELRYGDPFDKPFTEPFDVFVVRAQVTGVKPALSLLEARGRLWQKNIGRVDGWFGTIIGFTHRYEYVNTPSHQFGWQSVEMGLMSRLKLGKGYGIQLFLAGDAAMMGAIDAPFSGIGERTYDFGPGAGATLWLALARNGVVHLSWMNRGEVMHSVSGASADHVILLSGLEANIPITHGIGLGLYAAGDLRRSRYAGVLEPPREFADLRVFLTWTHAGRPTSPAGGGR